MAGANPSVGAVGRRALFSTSRSASIRQPKSVEPTTVKIDIIGIIRPECTLRLPSRRALQGLLDGNVLSAASSSCGFAPAPSVLCRN